MGPGGRVVSRSGGSELRGLHRNVAASSRSVLLHHADNPGGHCVDLPPFVHCPANQEKTLYRQVNHSVFRLFKTKYLQQDV